MRRRYGMKDEIINQLAVLIRTVAPEASGMALTAQTSLMEDLGLDESALMLLALAAEDEFDIRFSGSPELETLGDVAEYIEIISSQKVG